MRQVKAANVVATSQPVDSAVAEDKAGRAGGVTGVKLAFGSVVKGGAAAPKRSAPSKAPRSCAPGVGEETQATQVEEAKPARAEGRVAARPRLGGALEASAASLLPALFPAEEEAPSEAPARERGEAGSSSGSGALGAEERAQLALGALNLLRHLLWRSPAAVAAALDAGALGVAGRLLPGAAAAGAPEPLHELLGLLANLLGCQATAANIAAAANNVEAPGHKSSASQQPLLQQLLQLTR